MRGRRLAGTPAHLIARYLVDTTSAPPVAGRTTSQHDSSLARDGPRRDFTGAAEWWMKLSCHPYRINRADSPTALIRSSEVRHTYCISQPRNSAASAPRRYCPNRGDAAQRATLTPPTRKAIPWLRPPNPAIALYFRAPYPQSSASSRSF